MALEEDSLQDLMAVCSNGATLKEWSHAGMPTLSRPSLFGARQVLEHVICEDMQLAVEERQPRWIKPVTLTSLRMKKTITSEILRDSSERTMVPFLSFLPLLIRPFMYIFSSFSANTLLVHNFFTKCTCSSRVFLHRFAIVHIDVLLWRPGFESWFQFGD